MKNIYFFFVIVLIFAACKNQKSTDTPIVEEKPEPAANKYTLTPFSASQDFADAALTSINYKAGKFSAQIGGTSYKLGEQTPDAPQKQCANSKDGQHIHLI
ncbi:MAG TPA: hypothetical protein VMZ69_09325, partial [Saprospiraceae bacterium]|nr:hypothetical protein [Saprospiraceae bacterium]